MPVFRWGNAWGSLQEFEREMDRLLQSITVSARHPRSTRSYPAVNLYEEPHQYIITAEIPGVSPSDLDLSIAGGVLTIRGKRDLGQTVSEDQFRRRERLHGHWERSLTMPERVDEDDLSAELKEGILKIYLRKAKQVPARQIPVITS